MALEQPEHSLSFSSSEPGILGLDLFREWRWVMVGGGGADGHMLSQGWSPFCSKLKVPPAEKDCALLRKDASDFQPRY